MRLSDLDRIARRQHGVVALRQTNLSNDSWHRAIESGSLIAVHPGVARLVGTADVPEQHIAAAVLAAGPGALASHRSAAILHGIPAIDDTPIDIVVPRKRPDLPALERSTTACSMEGVVTHRPRDMARLTRQVKAGVACTGLLRTLLDVAAVQSDAVHGAIGHVLTNGAVSLTALEAVLVQHARPGRTGITAFRRALDDWAIDAKPADSVLEPAMRRLIANYGLPTVEFHPTIGGREVDFRIVGTPIVIECDGWTYHGRDRPQFERDRAMDAEFASHGWIVLRFTYRKITSRPSDVARLIRATVARWAGAIAPDEA